VLIATKYIPEVLQENIRHSKFYTAQIVTETSTKATKLGGKTRQAVETMHALST
jgi:hypothetical protein